jgi:hypothetical protein
MHKSILSGIQERAATCRLFLILLATLSLVSACRWPYPDPREPVVAPAIAPAKTAEDGAKPSREGTQEVSDARDIRYDF